MITRSQIMRGCQVPCGVRQEWRVECKYSGKGETVIGTFADACRVALMQCSRPNWDRYVVWDTEGDNNRRVAEIANIGIAYLFLDFRHLANDFPSAWPD